MNPPHQVVKRLEREGPAGRWARAKELGPGLPVACLIGSVAYAATLLIRSPLADPLLVAMIAGMLVRTAIIRGAGLQRGFSAVPAVCIPAVKPIYGLAWAVAMAGVGLNVDVKHLLSNAGANALLMAFTGCVAAIVTFLVGALLIGCL